MQAVPIAMKHNNDIEEIWSVSSYFVCYKLENQKLPKSVQKQSKEQDHYGGDKWI